MRKLIIELVSLCVFLNCFPVAASDKDSTSRKVISVPEIGFRPAYTFPTKGFFRGVNAKGEPIDLTLSAHLRYGFRFNPESSFGRMAPGSVQGIGIACNTFFNSEEIGNPVALYVFQTSRLFSFSKRLSLDYEWNFGASFGWKPYNEVSNPYNTVVGSKVNAYINIGFLLNYRLSQRLCIKTGASLSHFSNGNTGYPNSGVNTIGGNLSLAWDFGNDENIRRQETAGAKRQPALRDRLSYDVTLYGALKKKGFLWDESTAVIIPGSFAVAGMNVAPMLGFGKHFRAGLSVDAQYDESANIVKYVANTEPPVDNDVKFHRPPFSEQFAVGVSARAEVVMPVFSINVGLGRNIICKGTDTDSFYQIFALKAFVSRNAFIHIGYQLFKFHNPNNLMIGVGYRIKHKTAR